MDETVVMSTGTNDNLDYDEYEVNCIIKAVRCGLRRDNELRACGCSDCMEALRRLNKEASQ